ncbi:phosphohistidine phosphatase SixA [Nitrosomonas sp.]|uniref:phosphohistidine phosphatase SixA n=1 Tax=Nitrosomonas sp. TaxID=42353 RepID=UPI002618D523|nr:phosphohistidine phosphatase SixA [Nitrosomonas sp.]
MQKHQLIIMRHAKSDWSEGNGSDFERPLTPRGEKAAKQMGKWLQHRYRIDRIICSPAVRAKQTCQLVTEQLRLPQNHIRWESGIYDASLNDLISVIKKYSEDIHTLLLIGHNPGLDQLLCYLSRDPPPVNSTGKLLTTAAIAVLDYGDTAITAQPGHAYLQCLVRPKELS